ncbi:hypothetical protein G9C85_02545 [Halorubellus sp. JP-L1]|uniref:hypothetical protein n=1 Tax=Halorubellus sp. JP-L1 TaxID=2715753 RepID=UPI0014088E23|nr:hypothetical protein [Halorubellus sp. JP-L1]NHN40517.1 hypothetical protein [Halorubellus sp. JP-L1]
MAKSDTEKQASDSKATDGELIDLIMRATKDDDPPALLTSQINEIGEYDYSSTGLNNRLETLNEQGVLGHQKASGRHMWWIGEGDKSPEGLPSLEDLVEYEELDPEKFSEDKGREIAQTVIPGYESTYWDSLESLGNQLMFLGVGLFALSILLATTFSQDVPNIVSGVVVWFALASLFGAFLGKLGGGIGEIFYQRGRFSAEPFDGQRPILYLLRSLRDRFT